jgi:hypothetical protein
MTNEAYRITELETSPLITINKIDKMEKNMINNNFTNYKRDSNIIDELICRGHEPAYINFIESNVNTYSLSRNQSASRCAKRFDISEIIKYKSFTIFLSLLEEIFDSEFNKDNTFSKIQGKLKYIHLDQNYTVDRISIIVDISPNTITKLIEASECTSAIEKAIHKMWLGQKIIVGDPLEGILRHWIETKVEHSPSILKAQNHDKNKKQTLNQLSNNLKATHKKLRMKDLPED